MPLSQTQADDTDPNDELKQALLAQKIRVIDDKDNRTEAEDGRILSKLVEEDSFKNAKGYVFMGKPDLESTFLMYYAIDAAQSGVPGAFVNSQITIQDPDTGQMVSALKPIVICDYGPNGERPAKAFLERAQQLSGNGLLKTAMENIIHVVHSPEEVEEALNTPKLHKIFHPPKLNPDLEFTRAVPREEDKPSIFICCSFNTQDEFYVDLAKQLGEQLAQNYNIVTGGGRYPGNPDHGMMYNVQKSAYDAGADVTGVTFAALNPLAAHDGEAVAHFGLSRILEEGNLARRVETMVDLSDAIVIAPGGFGTDTEGVSPLLMKQVTSALIEDKPLILVNSKNPGAPDDAAVHEKLIALLETLGLQRDVDFHVVDSPTGISDPKELAKATAAAVIDKLQSLNVKTHARKLEASQNVTRTSYSALQ